MRRLSLVALLAALMALPSSASAVEIGSDLSGGPADLAWLCDNIGGGAGQGCVVAQQQELFDVNVNVVPSAGTLTAFHVRNALGSYRLRVFDASGNPVGQSPFENGGGTDVVVDHPLSPSIPVQAGDFIGIELGDSSEIGVRDATTEAGTNLQEFNLGSGVLQDEGPYELYLSATFQPNPASNPVIPPVVNNPVVPAKPDPLASLRSGKRPKAKIAGGVLAVSRKRVAAVSITNPNGFTLKGTASLVAGKLKLGKVKVSLGPNATKTFKLKLTAKAMKRLRKRRRLRATLTATLKGPIGKAGVTKKKLTLKAPPKAKKKKKKRKRRGGAKPPATGNLWVARNGTTGAYDDFKFRLEGGTINVTGTSLLFVSCFEIGGSYRSSFSYEVFNLLGPWKLGNQDATQTKRSRAVNQLVGSGERTITYKLTSSRSGNKITGKRTMSFSDSSYNPFDNSISFINCSGTQNYEAIPG